MQSPKFDENALFATNSDVVSCELDGGAALLDLTTSAYFKLNSTAAVVWAWLETETQTLDALASKMVEQFDVERDRCAADLVTVLSSFLDAGLIEHKDTAEPA